MELTYVFGHKNPDSDTILSSIVYADYLNQKGITAKAISLGSLNNETKYILNSLNIPEPEIIKSLPEGSNVILVDHNEATQTIDDISKMNIVGLIDHHKFGNFSTSTPLFVRTESLCSTCSVIYGIFRAEGYKPSQLMAKLMISAILSDSLLFKSPTTTSRDKEIVNELNEIAQINDITKYAMDMFNAKSDLGNIDVKELIQIDYKEFDFNGTMTGIGVIETVNPSYALGRKSEILKGLEEIKQKNGLNLIFLSIVDIINENNKTIVLGDEEKNIINSIYNVQTIDNIADLGNVLSRKKQIVPQFTDHFNK